MRSGALAQIMIAEALRACIRGVGLYGEVREWSETSREANGGLVRELLAVNAVRGIARELSRIKACGDLAAPIITYAEASAREGRLQQLGRSLPASHSLLETARGLIGRLPDGVLAGLDGHLLAPVRGHLVAVNESQIRAAEERLARSDWRVMAPDGVLNQPIGARAQARQCIELLHSEATAWRSVDTSRLANRLLADRGFLDTYSQARKRARSLVRAHNETDVVILQAAELQDLLRWHRSLVAQLELLDGGDDWDALQARARELEALLEGSLDVFPVVEGAWWCGGIKTSQGGHR